MMNISITISASTAQEARDALRGLLASTALSTVDETPYTPDEQISRALSVASQAVEQSVGEDRPQRERGKPSPGNARRTKAEIAEDEAAEAAEAALKKAGEETGAIVADKQITTRYFYHPESESLMMTEDGTVPSSDGHVEEIDKAKFDEIGAKLKANMADRDAADEAAETAAGKDADKPLTHDDVRSALGKYVKAYGMAAAQEDGPILIQKVLGDAGKSKISDLPDDQAVLAKAIAGVNEMLEKNPFKREVQL